MGDTRRFSLFADLIARNFAPSLAVADVAGGKGYLQAKLRKRVRQMVALIARDAA